MSKIEWTNETWNPVTGCTRASRGCDNCYAVQMTKRLARMEATKEKYSGLVNEGKNHFNGVVKTHTDVLEVPFKWRKPRKVFVNSMSDLFHPNVPFEFIDKVFAVMALTPQHTYQILTKRPERMAEYLNWQDLKKHRLHYICIEADIAPAMLRENWPLPNVWLGASIEDQKAADERIPHLLQCPAAVRFLSCEPLLGPVNLNAVKSGIMEHRPERKWDQPVKAISEIHWVIAGGESGHNARPMHPEWVRSLRDQCKESGVPFFFKQWGRFSPEISIDRVPIVLMPEGRVTKLTDASVPDGSHAMWEVGKKKAGRLLDGEEHNEFPM